MLFLFEDEPVVKREVGAGNEAGGEEGREGLEVAVVFEEGFGGESHLLEFFLGDHVERGAAGLVFAVFDLGEVDFVTQSRDNVDFVELGFVVAGDDLVALAY